jgi:hypothetical protein
VPRFSIGIDSTEVPRARTRSTDPSGVLRNSYGRSIMPKVSYSVSMAGEGASAGWTQKVRMLVNSRIPTAASSRPSRCA